MSLFLSTLHYFGVALIAFSIVLFAGFATGVVEFPEKMFPAESTVHSIARVGVIGCICAAIGSYD